MILKDPKALMKHHWCVPKHPIETILWNGGSEKDVFPPLGLLLFCSLPYSTHESLVTGHNLEWFFFFSSNKNKIFVLQTDKNIILKNIHSRKRH